MIYRMYQQGLHPKEISQSFGFDEGRVNAILRLMKAREGKKKAGLYTEKAVKEIEDSEDVFEYEYRDFPPADYKRAEKRREVKSLPRNLLKLTFSAFSSIKLFPCHNAEISFFLLTVWFAFNMSSFMISPSVGVSLTLSP